MAVITITPAAVEPITLDQARLQCNADSSADTMLALCIAGARAKCEGLTQHALITRTVEEAFDLFPTDEIALSLRQVQSIVSVVYTDTDGNAQTVDAANYVLDNRGDQAWLLPVFGIEWPGTEASINAVRVQYVAGFGPTADDVPGDIRTWLLLTIAFLYAQREAFDGTGKTTAIPNRFVDSLLDPWRVYGI